MGWNSLYGKGHISHSALGSFRSTIMGQLNILGDFYAHVTPNDSGLHCGLDIGMRGMSSCKRGLSGSLHVEKHGQILCSQERGLSSRTRRMRGRSVAVFATQWAVLPGAKNTQRPVEPSHDGFPAKLMQREPLRQSRPKRSPFNGRAQLALGCRADFRGVRGSCRGGRSLRCAAVRRSSHREIPRTLLW